MAFWDIVISISFNDNISCYKLTMKNYKTFDLWENEKIILIKRRHWFVYFLETIPFILMAFMPLAFFVALVTFVPVPLNLKPVNLSSPEFKLN